MTLAQLNLRRWQPCSCSAQPKYAILLITYFLIVLCALHSFNYNKPRTHLGGLVSNSCAIMLKVQSHTLAAYVGSEGFRVPKAEHSCANLLFQAFTGSAFNCLLFCFCTLWVICTVKRHLLSQATVIGCSADCCPCPSIQSREGN